MILFPIGFLATLGSPPENFSTASIVNTSGATIEYSAGAWITLPPTDITITVAWYFDGILQPQFDGMSSIDAPTDVLVTVIETATNDFGSADYTTPGITILGETVSISDGGTLSYDMNGSYQTGFAMTDAVDLTYSVNGQFIDDVFQISDAAGLTWGFDDTFSKYEDVILYPEELGAVEWEVTGSYV